MHQLDSSAAIELPNMAFIRALFSRGMLRNKAAQHRLVLRYTAMLIRYILPCFVIFSAHANAASPQVFATTCSGTTFQVTAVNKGHPLDNTFVLAAVTPAGVRELFKGEDGGWFHAACVPAKGGKSVLLFQSYCGGSGCLEGKYGVVEPSSLKLLLQPGTKNVENHKQASALLGTSAPHLGNYQGAFCCGE